MTIVFDSITLPSFPVFSVYYCITIPIKQLACFFYFIYHLGGLFFRDIANINRKNDIASTFFQTSL